MRIGKRSDLEHYSVAELAVQATRIAKGKRNKIVAARDLAWIVAGSNKHKLITYIASEGEEGGEKPPRTSEIPHWKRGK